jgi:hypothetical protein
MPFNYIEKYLEYNRGNECPRNYHIWSALFTLAAAVHKQVWVPQGYFVTYPNIYVGLIGDMGSRKSTAKDIAYDLFISTFPDYPILASVQSREAIIVNMNDDKALFSYKDPVTDAIVEVRPMAGFINELKNFLSVDPGKMIEFLTDIYSSKHFKSSLIKRGLEDLKNPCMNLLACETPDWIIDKLKGKIISGGWARRIVYVYETERSEPIPFPQKPADSQFLWNALSEHLIKVSKVVGPFEWEPDARKWYEDWYIKMRKKVHDDKLMAGYYESKHDQLLKVCMCHALAEEDIQRLITTRHLMLASATLDSIEGNLPKLSVAAGRNELSVPMQNVIELLEKNGGWMPEKALKRLMGKDMSPMEIESVMRFMSQSTDEIVVADIVEKVVDSVEMKQVRRKMVMMKWKHEELKKKS